MKTLSTKIPDFPAIRNQRNDKQAASTSKSILPSQTTSPSALQQVAPAALSQGKRTLERNRRSTSYYGFDNSSSYSTIAAPPKRPRRAVDVENFQPPPARVVETVQNIGVQ